MAINTANYLSVPLTTTVAMMGPALLAKMIFHLAPQIMLEGASLELPINLGEQCLELRPAHGREIKISCNTIRACCLLHSSNPDISVETSLIMVARGSSNFPCSFAAVWTAGPHLLSHLPIVRKYAD